MNTQKDVVVPVYEGENGARKLVAIVHRDEKTGHNLIHRCEAMTMDEIAVLLKVQRDESSKKPESVWTDAKLD